MATEDITRLRSGVDPTLNKYPIVVTENHAGVAHAQGTTRLESGVAGWIEQLPIIQSDDVEMNMLNSSQFGDVPQRNELL